MTKLYTFTNWGDRVYIKDNKTLERGVITEIDEPTGFDTKKIQVKVTYEGGGYDWYDRDELENDMKSRESAILDNNKKINERGTN